MKRCREYFKLTKPGIIYGNALTLVAGFMLASHNAQTTLEQVEFILLLATLIGLSLVIAAGCVFNNYFDRDIDALMERTRKRALVTGVISPKNALIFGYALFTLGVLILYFFTNTLAFILSLVGFFVYVFWYTMALKRHSTHSTLLGGIAGAMPPVVGYVSVLGAIDAGAVLLFLLLTIWQMPHSFGIALYRLSDYKKANVPVLPLRKGILATKIQIGVYIFLFLIIATSFYFFKLAHEVYIVIISLLSLWWLALSLKGFRLKEGEEKMWAKSIFKFSIIILSVFCFLLILGL